MTETKTKKRVLPAAAVTALLALTLSLCVWSSADKAQAKEPASWDNYDVITDAESGAFVGVRIMDDTEGTLSTVIPTGAATTTPSTADGSFAVVTFELEPFCVDDYTGMLVQLDRSHASANMGARFFLEADDGTLYRFNSGAKREDTVIKDDRTVTSWQNTSSRYTLTSISGTMYTPFSAIVKASDASAIPTGTTFTKFHYAVDTRSSGFYGDGRPTAFGTIAAVRADQEVTVKKLLGVAELTYTADAADSAADVNLADMTKGAKVYARHTISGGYKMDLDPAAIAAVNAVPRHTRLGFVNTLHFVDEEGKTIAADQTFTSAYNPATGKFDYQVEAPSLKGYVYLSSDPGLSGAFEQRGAVTLTYRAVEAPTLTARYVDEEGRELAPAKELTTQYDLETQTSSYELEQPTLFAHTFVSADKPLSGTIGEDTIITFTFRAKGFDRFTAVFSDQGEFAGVDLQSPMTGALVIDVTGHDASTGYALTTVELGAVDPGESTGILVRVKRTAGVGSAQVRMYLEDQAGTLYRLFTATGDRVPVGNTVLITPDGEISEVTNEAANWRHQFTMDTDGTMYVPWAHISTVDNRAIPEGTVFTRFHFGREMRYETTVGKPIALGAIAAVKVTGDDVLVDPLVDLAELTYSVDPANSTADVNLADMSKGAKVYFTEYCTGTNAIGTDQEVYGAMTALVDYTRMPPQITLRYVDEEGTQIKGETTVGAEYAAGGSTYDITPPSIVGYEFVSADGALSGVSETDFTRTLTYRKVVYTITIEFVDEQGETIKEARSVTGVFGDYIEVEADSIDGYTFKESTASLKFTVMGEKTIRLTYTENADKGCGCGAAAAVGGGTIWATAALAAVSAALAFRKKKTKKS